jgi:hypothetical protein
LRASPALQSCCDSPKLVCCCNYSAQDSGQSIFEALPPALHLKILLLAYPSSSVGRARCSLVSKSWAALLREPALWTELDFEGANAATLNAAVLSSLCRRSAGQNGRAHF